MFTGQAGTLQAARPNEQASKYAAYLRTAAGKQQLESASGFRLPMGVSLMGLPQYGGQLYVRPSYFQSREKLAQLSQDAGPYGDNTVMVSGTPAGKLARRLKRVMNVGCSQALQSISENQCTIYNRSSTKYTQVQTCEMCTVIAKPAHTAIVQHNLQKCAIP